MFSNLISQSTLIALGASALGILTIIAVFAAGLRLIRLATPKNNIPDFEQRVQGPQEAPTGEKRGV